MDLSEGCLTSGTVIISFCHDVYEEMNLKSHLNKENYCQIFTCPVWLYFTLLVCAHFCNETERYQL